MVFFFRYNDGTVVVFRKNPYLNIRIEIFTEEMIWCLRFVTNLGGGGEMEKVGMGVNETNHELIIIEARCKDT